MRLLEYIDRCCIYLALVHTDRRVDVVHTYISGARNERVKRSCSETVVVLLANQRHSTSISSNEISIARFFHAEMPTWFLSLDLEICCYCCCCCCCCCRQRRSSTLGHLVQVLSRFRGCVQLNWRSASGRAGKRRRWECYVEERCARAERDISVNQSELRLGSCRRHLSTTTDDKSRAAGHRIFG